MLRARFCNNRPQLCIISQTMDLQMASIMLRGSIYDWYALPFIAGSTLIAFATTKWRFLIQWLRSIRGGAGHQLPPSSILSAWSSKRAVEKATG